MRQVARERRFGRNNSQLVLFLPFPLKLDLDYLRSSLNPGFTSTTQEIDVSRRPIPIQQLKLGYSHRSLSLSLPLTQYN